MAFLDNSGDIILDAVLTDLGRKRLAEGNFRITQFAFGDDEIDYALYDKNHPSGSAYYDLEILQTPVFESFTRTNANINYGLASFNGNPNLLYLPSMVLNEKTAGGTNNVQTRANIIYLATGGSTVTALQTTARLGTSFRLLQNAASSNYVLFETGLNTVVGTSDKVGSLANQTNFVINEGLLDPNFTLSADNRLFSAIKPMTAASQFTMDGTAYTKSISLAPSGTPLSTGNQDLDNYGSVNVLAGRTQVYSDQNNGSVTDTSLSNINGPRGAFAGFIPVLASNLAESDSGASATRPAEFDLYGKVNQNLFSAGQLFDFIDTVVYVRGQTTGASAQAVIRIIRKV